MPLLRSVPELGDKQTNELALDDAAISWLEQQLLDGAKSVTLRVLPNLDADTQQRQERFHCVYSSVAISLRRDVAQEILDRYFSNNAK